MRTFSAIAAASLLTLASSSLRADTVLYDFEGDFDLSIVEANDVRLELAETGDGNVLRVRSGHSIDWPGITLKPKEGEWNLAAFNGLALDAHNLGKKRLQVGIRIDNTGGDGAKNCNQKIYVLAAGERRTLELEFIRRMDTGLNLFGMRGYPGNVHTGAHSVDPARFIQIIIFVPKPETDHAFTIDGIRAYGKYEGVGVVPEEFFPFIDEFGQYMHKDWPGKTHSRRDLKRRLDKEARDLKHNPGPANWDKYGGWLDGPQMKATGHFYPKKHDGKWWLVDPEGRLFFSHGIDCVGAWADTPINDRETWFKDFPGDREDFKQFWGETTNVVRDYYKGKKVRYFNWAGANIMRKYGENWAEKHREHSHQRLRSWGLNTLGNWSSHEFFTMKRTPYVVAIHFGGKVIQGSEGYWAQFRDVFDPDFRKQLKGSLEGHKTLTANDPYLIGYFVDNEISWGNETSLAVATLASPADQVAKKEFVKDLKKKYRSVGKLNRSWGTQHESWEALLESTSPPEKEKAKDDLLAFNSRIADEYFRTCREEVKAIAPSNMYLGPRFAWVNDLAFEAAARYCDIISYNLYWRDVSGFNLPGNADYPVIIGEWHAGALDRGMFMPGLITVNSQEERGEFYRNYATGALKNPLFVGCHWFQYRDQATTGRSLDGENYQIGFLDVVDTPYPETIAACRDVGYRLYAIRSEE